MKILLIGNARADAYVERHRLRTSNVRIIRDSLDLQSLHPHPDDTLIYFGDEAPYTMDELWRLGFCLRRTHSQFEPPPSQQSLF